MNLNDSEMELAARKTQKLKQAFSTIAKKPPEQMAERMVAVRMQQREIHPILSSQVQTFGRLSFRLPRPCS